MPEVVFLDFEASSLEKRSYPIEVAWVRLSGHGESHLIKPAPEWTDWSDAAEAIHGIRRAQLFTEGTPHDELARHMVDLLSECELYASAPSWDGQWLSKLLRAAGLPRHSLRLRDTEMAQREAADAILKAAQISSDVRARIIERVIAEAKMGSDRLGPPAHRALADAQRELEIWKDVCARAEEATRSRRLDEQCNSI